MSIQRWRDTGVMVADNERGWWVWYEDHVTAMQAEAESAHDLGVIYGINHERARIKAAVEALNPYRMNSFVYNVPAYKAVKVADVLAIIDGEQA